MQTLTKSKIIYLLYREKNVVKEQFGVTSIGLFGSFARECQTNESDIDLLVDFERPVFDSVVGLQIYLEERFGKKVGIVRNGSHLSQRFRSVIEKNIVYV